MRVRIIIADENPLIRIGFNKICSEIESIDVIDTVTNGVDLIKSYELNQPDVIIVDLSIPIINGIEALKIIKKNYLNVKCLFYSFCKSKIEIFELYKNGAAGFLCKSRETFELILAIEKIANGNLFFDRNFTNNDYLYIQKSLNSKNIFMIGKSLSKREQDILPLISNGLTNQRIAERLCISKKTVEAHKRNIRRKLGLQGSTELLKYAIKKMGYKELLQKN